MGERMRLTPFGNQVRRYRLESNITLSDMAGALNITPAYLSAVETAREPLRDELVQNIVAYLKILKIDAHDLVGLADPPAKDLPLHDLEEHERQALSAFVRRLPEMPRSQRRAAIQRLLDWDR
jgi:HTH-type transcriptional regulator, competence development regulator